MARLELDQVRDIGTAAARRLIGDTFTEVEVILGDDWLNREVYFFTFYFPTEESWNQASRMAARIMAAIIDDLYARGDARFPHVRLRSDGSWTYKRDVAAE